MRYFVGIDVGGTTTTLALGNERREVLKIAEQFPTRSEAGPHESVRAISQQVHVELGKLGASIADLTAVGLATPGPATLDGELLQTPNLSHPDWNRFPMRGALEAALKVHQPGVQVCYIGDGQAAALGEYAIRRGDLTMKDGSLGSKQTVPLDSLFMAIVGTGLGGGAVHGRHVVRGGQGRAGHIGHTSLPIDAFRYDHDRQLLVGHAYSTAESAISLKALTHQLEYRLSLPPWSGHSLNSMNGTMRDKAKQLRSLAADGDPLALELFADQARALGITLLNANYFGDYDLLVIGGGVCDLAPAVKEMYLRETKEAYHEHALEGFRQHVSIEFSACGDDAPVIGSLAWVYNNHELPVMY